MKKNFVLLIALFSLFLLSSSKSAQARPTMALSVFGGGNFPLTTTFPDLSTGWGGGLEWDYRFNQHWAISTALSVFDHGSQGISHPDGNVLLLNLPDIDLKYYWFGNEKKWDPYFSAGLGFSVLSGGKVKDHSGGAGLAANFGAGFDYYLTPRFSAGFLAGFKSVGLIRGNSQSSALIFLSTLGNLTLHFK